MMDGFAPRFERVAAALDGFAARGVSYSRRATTVRGARARIDRYINQLINRSIIAASRVRLLVRLLGRRSFFFTLNLKCMNS